MVFFDRSVVFERSVVRITSCWNCPTNVISFLWPLGVSVYACTPPALLIVEVKSTSNPRPSQLCAAVLTPRDRPGWTWTGGCVPRPAHSGASALQLSGRCCDSGSMPDSCVFRGLPYTESIHQSGMQSNEWDYKEYSLERCPRSCACVLQGM